MISHCHEFRNRLVAHLVLWTHNCWTTLCQRSMAGGWKPSSIPRQPGQRQLTPYKLWDTACNQHQRVDIDPVWGQTANGFFRVLLRMLLHIVQHFSCRLWARNIITCTTSTLDDIVICTWQCWAHVRCGCSALECTIFLTSSARAVLCIFCKFAAMLDEHRCWQMHTLALARCYIKTVFVALQ